MRAVVKTLFGDGRNVVAVGVVVGLAELLNAAGHAEWAVYAMPVAILAAVAWLALN